MNIDNQYLVGIVILSGKANVESFPEQKYINLKYLQIFLANI